jgi:hypothetical protein
MLRSARRLLPFAGVPPLLAIILSFFFTPGPHSFLQSVEFLGRGSPPRFFCCPDLLINNHKSPLLGEWVPSQPILPTFWPRQIPMTFHHVHEECIAEIQTLLENNTTPFETTAIKNAFLLPRSPVVITEAFRYFPLSFDQQDYPRRSRFMLRASEHEVLDECIYFYHRHHENYFHLVIESFPHLLAFNKSVIARSAIIHGADVLSRTFKALLWVFDLRPVQLIPLSRKIFVRTLHICTP